MFLDMINIKRGYEEKYKEFWYSESEDKVPELIEFLSKAQSSVKIADRDLRGDYQVASGWAPYLEDAHVIGKIRCLLHQNVKIEILFHKADTKPSSIEGLIIENLQLVKLKQKHPDGLSLYWAEKMGAVDYAIADNTHICLETPHKPYGNGATVFKYETQNLARKWSERFDSALNLSHKIGLEELVLK